MTHEGQTGKLEFIKIKNFISSKDTAKRMNSQIKEKKIFVKCVSVKELCPVYIKNA